MFYWWHGEHVVDFARLLIGLPISALPPIPQVRAVARAALFVTQILPLRVKPQERLSPTPVREAVTYQCPGGEMTADLYRVPDGKSHAGVLVFLGIITAPRDDHRVVNLGKALARAGFVAMFPWSSSMMQKRLDSSEPENLVSAFKYLRALEDVDPERVGMGGFCVGASMCLVAASDSRIKDDVSFVSAFGGYYDMVDLMAQISSNRSFYGQVVESWKPNHLTEEVLRHHLIEGIGDERERGALTRAFVPGVASPGLELEGLSRHGRAVHRLLSSMAASDEEEPVTLEQAHGLLRGLPGSFLEGMGSISPSASIGNLKARVLIAHDREDDLVPAEESRRLADSLSPRGDFSHTQFSFFSHVTPNKRVGPSTFVREALKLFRYTYSIVRVGV